MNELPLIKKQNKPRLEQASARLWDDWGSPAVLLGCGGHDRSGEASSTAGCRWAWHARPVTQRSLPRRPPSERRRGKAPAASRVRADSGNGRRACRGRAARCTSQVQRLGDTGSGGAAGGAGPRQGCPRRLSARSGLGGTDLDARNSCWCGTLQVSTAQLRRYMSPISLRTLNAGRHGEKKDPILEPTGGPVSRRPRPLVRG